MSSRGRFDREERDSTPKVFRRGTKMSPNASGVGARRRATRVRRNAPVAACFGTRAIEVRRSIANGNPQRGRGSANFRDRVELSRGSSRRGQRLTRRRGRQGSPRMPSIIRRASKRRAGGARSSAARPSPRASRSGALSFENTRTSEIGDADRRDRSSARASREGGEEGVARRAPGSASDAPASASSPASRRPRFSPWPATGCSVCAALPIATARGPASLERRNQSRSG